MNIVQLLACSSKSTETVTPVVVPPVTTPPVANNSSVIPEVDTEVATLMSKYNVPGVSIAITKDGKLVYAKGYGFANNQTSEKVSTNSLFRIASLSKQVTSIAIMKLVQDGKLSLDATVFGTAGILGTQYGAQPYSANIDKITVRQLLQHTSGGWQNDNNDPMFTNPSLSANDLITWTLNNRPLNTAPGASYAYSNFGYCVLGRIIEKVSGKSYDSYVKTDILQPLGITNMQIGGNTEADIKTNEVKYYAQGGENPYIYNVTRMDAHGGWVATATDMVKLLVHADGFTTKPDILSARNIQTMITPSSANANYALGFMVNASGNWWHTGSLPGTYTMLARTSGGFTWCILTNTRSGLSSFGGDIDQLVWKAVNNPNTQWPTNDLF